MIWSVSKSGSALQALTNSDIADRALSNSVSAAEIWASSERGQTIVNSVSPGHAAISPEVGGS